MDNFAFPLNLWLNKSFNLYIAVSIIKWVKRDKKSPVFRCISSMYMTEIKLCLINMLVHPTRPICHWLRPIHNFFNKSTYKIVSNNDFCTTIGYIMFVYSNKTNRNIKVFRIYTIWSLILYQMLTFCHRSIAYIQFHFNVIQHLRRSS